jgi:hypothetical protein
MIVVGVDGREFEPRIDAMNVGEWHVDSISELDDSIGLTRNSVVLENDESLLCAFLEFTPGKGDVSLATSIICWFNDVIIINVSSQLIELISASIETENRTCSFDVQRHVNPHFLVSSGFSTSTGHSPKIREIA